MTLRGYDAWKTSEPVVDGPASDERDDFEKGYDQAIQEAIEHLAKNDHRAAAYELRKTFARKP